MRAGRPAVGSAARPVPRWRSVLLRAGLFAALWWVLVEGSVYGWVLAVLTIAAATGTSLALLPPGRWRLRPAGLLRFVPFFFWQSVRGGVDVARRAFHPRLPIQPGEVVYPLRLPPGPARPFFAAVLSLLPGTLSIELLDDRVRIHALDDRLPVTETLRRLEHHVAALFGSEPERTG
jgi:multicomponent Na+:H+ antiporter subunit E